jgi:hypothetical protein
MEQINSTFDQRPFTVSGILVKVSNIEKIISKPKQQPVSRACFLCYDPECFMSEAPTIMDKAFIDTFSPAQPRNETPGAIINQQSIIEK